MVGVTFYQYLHVVSLVASFARGEILQGKMEDPKGMESLTWSTRDEKDVVPLPLAEGEAGVVAMPRTRPPRDDEVNEVLRCGVKDLLRKRVETWSGSDQYAVPTLSYSCVEGRELVPAAD